MKFYLHENTLLLILEPLMWPFSKYFPEQAGSEIMEKLRKVLLRSSRIKAKKEKSPISKGSSCKDNSLQR
jgi:hypothetical protein